MRVEHSQKWIVQTQGASHEYTASDVLDPKPESPKGGSIRDLVVSILPRDGQEHLAVVVADVHGVPLAVSRVATGSVDQCPLFARDIYSFALAVPRARFVGIAHNHPSGDVTPSGPDGSGSNLVARIGKMLGLDLLWSMVVTHESAAWALVPLKHASDPTGEREPQNPKDPEPEEPEESPEGDEPEESPEGDGGDEPEGEPEESKGEPEGEPEEGGVDYDAPPQEDRRPLDNKSTATIDDLKAAVKVAFGIK